MRLHVEYRPDNLPLIAGNTEASGQQIDLADPWGNLYRVHSGHKPDYGPGGFEFNALPGKPYTIKVSGQTWHFEHRDGMTFLTWTGEPEPPGPEPPPEPEPPGPEPPEPEPPEPEPERILVKPGIDYSARLQGDIIYYQEGVAEDAVWWFTGQHLPGANLWLPLSERLTAELLAAWYGELRLRVERYGRAIQAMS